MPDVLAASPGATAGDEAFAVVREHLQRIGFGSITLTIHDSKIVQLEVTEKRRLIK